MNHISRSLHRKTGGNFITGIVSFLELNTGRFVFANAGHPPLVLIRANGTAELIGAKGRMISDIGPPGCVDHELFLNDNDMIILYTDGIIEERLGNEFYGEDRFIGILKHNYMSSPELLCNAVVDSLIDFKGNPAMDDDLTILALRYKCASKN
jgi:phosphoserine phosphatase RsbU/P